MRSSRVAQAPDRSTWGCPSGMQLRRLPAVGNAGLGGELDLEVLVALLRRTATDDTAGRTLDRLAAMLPAALPGRVRVERAAGFPLLRRPVRAVEVDFDEVRLRLNRDRRGSVQASAASLVRGIVLRTDPVSLDDWFVNLGRHMWALAESDVAARDTFQGLLG